jgi:hypothetical protein
MSKALETGKSILDTVLAKLPESLRDSAKAAFTAPEAADALTELGARGLAQSDYSRQMDEIRRKEQELATAQEQINTVATQQTDWWNVNKPALDEYTRLKAGGTVIPPVATPPAAPAGISKEELEKYLGERDRSYATVLGLTTTLATQHYKNFGEVLDAQELIAFAEKNRLPLAEAYQQKFAEPIKARNEKLENERIDKLVQERLATERAQLAGQPFPLRNADPSVLDTLNQQAPDKAQYSAEAAAAEYHRITSGV